MAELTPLQNVLLPASFERFTLDGAIRARAAALLDRFAVPQARRTTSRSPAKTAVCRAARRALLYDPPVILADEPTARLDAAAGAAVTETLVRLAKTKAAPSSPSPTTPR